MGDSNSELLRRMERLESRVSQLEDEALDPPMLKAFNMARREIEKELREQEDAPRECWMCEGRKTVAGATGTNLCPECKGTGVEG